MRALIIATAIALITGSVSAAECRYVDIESPDFSIVFDDQGEPVLRIGDETELYDTGSVGTGISTRVAYARDGDDTKTRAYEIHEFDGHTFLTWGADLLVERCD